jgi:CheY-like chemotaxis protein
LNGFEIAFLCVDDNFSDRLLVDEAIRRTYTPFMFDAADGVESAVAHCQTRLQNGDAMPALILLDYEMGGHTGIDFLHWLRVQKQIPSLPVIMYSGSADGTRIVKCYSAGADHFLQKPRELERIMAIIRALYFCMSFSPPRFGLLSGLAEYRADPRTPATV